jgi:hypothetical protein
LRHSFRTGFGAMSSSCSWERSWLPGHGRCRPPCGDGLCNRAPLHQLPQGLEPGHLVNPPSRSDSLRNTHHAPRFSGSPHCPGSRRPRGTPHRAQDQGQRLLPGCHALDEEARHPLFRPEVGSDDALGPGAVEPADLGAAVSHRAEWARREETRRLNEEMALAAIEFLRPIIPMRPPLHQA